MTALARHEYLAVSHATTGKMPFRIASRQLPRPQGQSKALTAPKIQGLDA